MKPQRTEPLQYPQFAKDGVVVAVILVSYVVAFSVLCFI